MLNCPCINDIPIESWVELISSFAAVVVALMAIIHSNKNSRESLEQQNEVLKYQHNEKKLDEYNRCLRDNLELLNVADLLGPIVFISHADYSLTKREICTRKSKIYSYDLRYKYMFSDHEVDIKNLLVEYDSKWDRATKSLSDLLDKMLEYVEYLSRFASENEILKNVVQQIHIYSRMMEIDKMNSAHYASEIERLRNEQFELSSRQSNFRDDVDKYTDDIQLSINSLQEQSAALFRLSQNVIAELKRQLLG